MSKSFTHTRLFCAIASCLVASMATTSLLAQDSASDSDQAQGAGVLEEVIVTSVRRSMENALNVKRDSASIVDAISYDDIAALPALDLGEALQAIPGVQVNREGERRSSEINLRGLPGGFVKVTANGQGFATPSRSTGAPLAEQNPFGAFDAKVFDGVTVIKTPSADMQEGGIAGTIDKRLANALEKKDGRYSVQVGTRYEELNDSWDYEFAAEASKHIIPDELAFVFKFAWSEQNFRRDSLSNSTYQNLDSRVFSGVDDWRASKGIAAGDVVQYGRDIRQFTEYNEGDRTSFIGGLEWAPSDEFKMGMDLLYTQRDMDESTLEIFGIDSRYRNRTGISITPIGDPVMIATQEDGTNLWVVPEYEFSGARYQPGNRGFTFFEEARGVFFDAEWQKGNWTVDGAATFSDSTNEFEQTNFSTWYIAKNNSGGISGRYGSGAGRVRDYYLILDDWQVGTNLDQAFSPSSTPADDNSVTGADGRTLFFTTGSFQNRDRDQRSFEANAQYDLNWGLLSSLKFGVRQSSEDLAAGRVDISANGIHVENISSDLYAAPYYVGSTNFFGGNAPGFLTYEGGWLSFDSSAYHAAALGDGVSNPNGLPTVGSTGFLAKTLRDQVTVARQDMVFDSSLDITAAYLMANLETTTSGGRDIWGNVGVRFVETDLSADGTSLDNGAYVPKKVGNSYDNLLPSINFNMSLTEELILRAAYNETMVRPSLASFTPSGSLTENDNTVTIILPGSDLEPYTADSFDISLEWYNRQGSAVTFAFYQKDVKSFFEKQAYCPEDGGSLGYGPLELIDNGDGSFTCFISEPYDPGTGEDPYQREMRATQTVNTNESLKLN
ncbi:MAG: TonB-dependent receptor, partial [Gammaproteobacteria bacterium]